MTQDTNSLNSLNTTPNVIKILSIIQVYNIGKEYLTGAATKASLARKYMVSPDTISRALQNFDHRAKNLKTQSKAALVFSDGNATDGLVIKPFDLGEEKLEPKVKTEKISTSSKLYDLINDTKPLEPNEKTLESFNAPPIKSIATTGKGFLGGLLDKVVVEKKDSDITVTSPSDLIEPIKVPKDNPVPTAEQVQKLIESDKKVPLWQITPDSISIFKIEGGVVKNYVCDSSHNEFENIQAHVIENTVQSIDKAISLIVPRIKLINMSRGLISVRHNSVYYKETRIDNKLTRLILNKLNSGQDDESERLFNFMTRLFKNPSSRSVKRLYDFMEHHDIKILKDGNILTLKAVRDSYLDIHSNSVLNKPGMTVAMERWEVDDNDRATCSHGYHVGAKAYVEGYGGSSSRYLTCIVDPANVVSIPTDHNDTKCRVCEYYVDREYTREEISSNSYLKDYEL